MTRRTTTIETEPPDFLTVEEAATVLRIGRTTAYELAGGFLAGTAPDLAAPPSAPADAPHCSQSRADGSSP